MITPLIFGRTNENGVIRHVKGDHSYEVGEIK